jgi:hypothetical protein
MLPVTASGDGSVDADGQAWDGTGSS